MVYSRAARSQPDDWDRIAARTPSAAGVPVASSYEDQTESAQQLQKQAAISSNPVAAFGIVVRTLEDSGAQGFEILDVADDSPANSAGLRPGYVINSMDGRRIRTIKDLLLEFKSRAPETRVQIGYIFHTNLGWMGNRIVATLGPAPRQK
jgi:membrane-associated protease RseP (regulator of RpoE activity)